MDDFSEEISLLKKKGQIILYGPPGTGKTWRAKQIAKALMEEDDSTATRRTAGLEAEIAMALREYAQEKAGEIIIKTVSVDSLVSQFNKEHPFNEILSMSPQLYALDYLDEDAKTKTFCKWLSEFSTVNAELFGGDESPHEGSISNLEKYKLNWSGEQKTWMKPNAHERQSAIEFISEQEAGIEQQHINAQIKTIINLAARGMFREIERVGYFPSFVKAKILFLYHSQIKPASNGVITSLFYPDDIKDVCDMLSLNCELDEGKILYPLHWNKAIYERITAIPGFPFDKPWEIGYILHSLLAAWRLRDHLGKGQKQEEEKRFVRRVLAMRENADSSAPNEMREAMEDKDNFRSITFHPSYGYEEFVEGITIETSQNPLDEGSGVIKYKLKEGIFKEICKIALASASSYPVTEELPTWPEVLQHYRESKIVAEKTEGGSEEGRAGTKSDFFDKARKYVLLIDEINRGDMAKIFGELITLLEWDKRIGGKDEAYATLTYSNDIFGVPRNLYIIGTMNTADASLALIDIALRRRFSFIECMPNPEKIRVDVGDNRINGLLNKSMKAWQKINVRIASEGTAGRDRQIGHSYLMEARDEEDLLYAWKYQIIPLLEEYFYGNYNMMSQILFGDARVGPSEESAWTKLSKDGLAGFFDRITNSGGGDGGDTRAG